MVEVNSIESGSDAAEDSMPGLGDTDFPGFPADLCPSSLPDLSRHHSTCADILREEPAIYDKLRSRRTSLGVGLGRCIKVGIDNRGHKLVKSIGAVAGDEECFDTFRELFDPVINRHLDYPLHGLRRHHSTSPAHQVQDLTTIRADTSGKYVLSCKVCGSRNVRGFRFPPAMTKEERWQVERLTTAALLDLTCVVSGEYLPLRGSCSYAPRFGGMDLSEEDQLRGEGLLVETPDSSLKLCTGAGRHWPHGRGVFVNGRRNFVVWINDQDHLRAVSTREGDAVQLAFEELTMAFDSVAASLRRACGAVHAQSMYAHSDRLGYLTSNPAYLGTAMNICITVQVPLLGAQEGAVGRGQAVPVASWREWCFRHRVQTRPVLGGTQLQGPCIFELSNCDTIGISEVDMLNHVVAVAAKVVEMEQRLEKGQTIFDLLQIRLTQTFIGNIPRAVCAAEHAVQTNVHAQQETASRACAILLFGLMTGQLLDAMHVVGGDLKRAELALGAAGASAVPCCDFLGGEQPTAAALFDGLLSSAVEMTLKEQATMAGVQLIEEDHFCPTTGGSKRSTLQGTVSNNGLFGALARDLVSHEVGNVSEELGRLSELSPQKATRENGGQKQVDKADRMGAGSAMTIAAVSVTTMADAQLIQDNFCSSPVQATSRGLFGDLARDLVSHEIGNISNELGRLAELSKDQEGVATPDRTGAESAKTTAATSVATMAGVQQMGEDSFSHSPAHATRSTTGLLGDLARDLDSYDIGSLSEELGRLASLSQEGVSNEKEQEGVEEPGEPSIDNLREKLHDKLFEALDEGRLTEMVSEAMEGRGSHGAHEVPTIPPATIPLECGNVEVQTTLEALDEGRLTEMVSEAMEGRDSHGVNEVPAIPPATILSVTIPPECGKVDVQTTVAPVESVHAFGKFESQSPFELHTQMKRVDLVVVEAICARERRIGELTALIQEAERKIADREATCQFIQAKITSAKFDLAHADLDIEWHRQALQGAHERNVELDANHRRLLGELDGHGQAAPS